MKIGVIVNTGVGFDVEKHINYLINCINSIKRQNASDVKIVVLCKNKERVSEKIESVIKEEIQYYNNAAKGLNKCIKDLDCTHFIICRYNTVFSMNSFEIMNSHGTSLVFNATVKGEVGEGFVPLYKQVGIINLFKNYPFVYNTLFDKKTVEENNITFSAFSLCAQYMFLIEYFASVKDYKEIDDVLICIDKRFNLRLHFSYDFYTENIGKIFKIAKKLRKNNNVKLLSAFVRDVGLPMIERIYTETDSKKRKFYSNSGKKLLKIADSRG